MGAVQISKSHNGGKSKQQRMSAALHQHCGGHADDKHQMPESSVHFCSIIGLGIAPDITAFLFDILYTIS